MEFGTWLRSEIERRGLSVSEFARRIGVGHGTVSRWLSGSRRPDTESAARIARVLGVPPGVVLDLLGQQRPPSTETEHLEQRLARLRAERAALDDEDRQRGNRMDELDREIHELEIAQMRLNATPNQQKDEEYALEDMVFDRSFVHRSPTKPSDWVYKRDRRGRTADVDVPGDSFAEIRALLNLMTNRWQVGRDTHAFLQRVSEDWSPAEQQAFAVGLRLGLAVGETDRAYRADKPRETESDNAES